MKNLKIILPVLFLCANFFGFSQTAKTDSLLIILKIIQEDTNKLNILYQLSEESINDKDVLFYAEKALPIARQLSKSSIERIAKSGKRGIANASNNIGYVYMNKNEMAEALNWFNESLKIVEELSVGSSKGDEMWKWAKHSLATTYNNFGFIYDKLGDFNAALKWYYKSLTIQEEIGDKDGIARSYNNIGAISMSQGDIPKALECYRKSLKIREEIGDKAGVAATLNNIGVINMNQGNIAGALEAYHKSLKIREEINDKSGISTSCNNIGFVYMNQDEVYKALEWYSKSLKIAQEIGNKKGVGLALNNIGAAYMNLSEHQPNLSKAQRDSLLNKAMEWYYKSLKMKEEIGDKLGLASSLNNIGSIYLKQGNESGTAVAKEEFFRKALEAFKKSLMLYEEIGDKRGISNSLNYIGIINFNQNNFVDADNYCSRSLQVAVDIGFPENIRNASEWLSKIYKALGNSSAPPIKRVVYLQKAIEMHELFKRMADSINNIATHKSGLKKELQYEYERKESAARAEQEKKDAIALKELQRQKVVRNSFIGGFVLVLALAIIVYRSFRQKQKSNIEITAQKHIIEVKQKEILDSIRYAKRIQNALMSSEKYIEKTIQRLSKKKDS